MPALLQGMLEKYTVNVANDMNQWDSRRKLDQAN